MIFKLAKLHRETVHSLPIFNSICHLSYLLQDGGLRGLSKETTREISDVT